MEDGDKIIVYHRREFYNRQGHGALSSDQLIAQLAGYAISAVEVLSGAALRIHFSSGISLVFADRLNDFENFAFQIDDNEYIV